MDEREVKRTLQDYRWMLKTVIQERKLLEDDCIIGQGLTAQGGIESVMPKPQGMTSDPVANEALRRNQKSKWILKIEGKLAYIQKRVHVITDEREKVVLECLLDGMSMKAIGQHLELSEKHVRRLRDSVAAQMSEMSEMSGMSDKLRC